MAKCGNNNVCKQVAVCIIVLSANGAGVVCYVTVCLTGRTLCIGVSKLVRKYYRALAHAIGFCTVCADLINARAVASRTLNGAVVYSVGHSTVSAGLAVIRITRNTANVCRAGNSSVVHSVINGTVLSNVVAHSTKVVTYNTADVALVGKNNAAAVYTAENAAARANITADTSNVPAGCSNGSVVHAKRYGRAGCNVSYNTAAGAYAIDSAVVYAVVNCRTGGNTVNTAKLSCLTDKLAEVDRRIDRSVT